MTKFLKIHVKQSTIFNINDVNTESVKQLIFNFIFEYEILGNGFEIIPFSDDSEPNSQEAVDVKILFNNTQPRPIIA